MVLNIEGLSGSLANVNTDYNLTVAFPLDETQAGYGKILSEVDAGDYLDSRYIRRLKTSRDFRLRTGFDTILFNEYFSNTTLNTSVWTAPVTTSTVVCADGFVTLNANASVASAAVARLTSYRTFPVIGPYGVYFEIVAKFNSIPISNNITEWGAGICTGTSAPTDGVFFRLTATGELKAIMNYNGTEVMSPPLDFESLIGVNTTHVFVITTTDGEVKYWIDDTLVAVIDIMDGAPFSTSSGSLPLFARTYNVTAVSIAQKISIGQVSVTFADIVTNKPIGHNYSSDGSMLYEYPSNWISSSIGQTAQFSVSANPTAKTPTITTSSLGTGLGGVFLANIGGVGLGTTDAYVICSYQVPQATKKIPGQTLYITGIKFDAKNEGATNAANPLTWQVIAAYGKSDGFDPLNIPGIRGYWTAEEVTLNGTNVSAMSEITNIDPNMDTSQANTSLQPPYISNGINGLPAINFTGNKYLISPTWATATTQPTTCYTVYKPTSFSTQNILIDGIIGANRNTIYTSNNVPTIYTSGGAELKATGRPLLANENIVQCSVFNSSSSEIYINNYSTTSAAGSIGSVGLTGILFGADISYANSANAYFGCHYTFLGTHDEATRKRIMEYLSRKYSITVTGTPTSELTADTDITKINRLVNLGVQSIAASAVAGEQASPTVFVNFKEGPIVVQQGEQIQILIKFINFTDTASQALWCYATFTGYWE